MRRYSIGQNVLARRVKCQRREEGSCGVAGKGGYCSASISLMVRFKMRKVWMF